MTLQEHIRAEAALSFRLGTRDCAHFVAEWVGARVGRDPLALFDGLSRDTAERLLAEKRLLRAFFQGCRSVGLVSTKTPAAGDVGVIRNAGRHRCAIKTARGWVFRDNGGVVFVADQYAVPVMAWSVP